MNVTTGLAKLKQHNQIVKGIALVILIAGVTSLLTGQAPPNTTGKQGVLNSAPAPGRYQIVMNPNIRADTFLLDTQTGKIWVPTQYTNLKNQPTVWKVQERVDSDQEFTDWITRQTFNDK